MELTRVEIETCCLGHNQDCQISHPNWVKFAPNGTNLGLFKISSPSQNVLKLILKSLGLGMSDLNQISPDCLPPSLAIFILFTLVSR